MTRSLLRIAGSGAVVALMVAVGALVAPGAVQAAAATADVHVDSEWADGYVATTTIHSTDGLTGWRVEFDLPADTTISHHWDASLTRSGNRVVVTPAAWNGTVAAGGSVTFGWVTRGTGKPANCTVNALPCAGGPDITAPAAPTNFRAVAGSSTFTLRWDASTSSDVVAYQVVANGRQIAEVTGTSHVMPPPPPMVFVYGVRAVDAAGNLSPFAVLGQGTPTDVVPPSAPTRFTINVQGGLVVIGWAPSTDNVMVAGYQVSVNESVSRVGGTSVKAVYRPGRVYQVRITAFDGAGNLSIPLVASVVLPVGPSTPVTTHPIPSDPVPSIPVTAAPAA
jgi:hypothetical protein